ncbi:hypothetical protein [Collimonas sp.]|uniref:hypothetical protein n=1 Tax=Collimonas sp. TaxID=1963772 RepID=UPI002C5B6E39|nr:hypothetical protein [Collimonas sp.]HWW04779.1 hypothetical protein [Collimonas sp.]
MTTVTIQYAGVPSLYLSVDTTGKVLFSTTPSKWDTNNPVTKDNFQNVTLQLNSPGSVDNKKYLCCPPNPSPGDIFLMEASVSNAASFTQGGPNIGGFPITINGSPNVFLNRTLQNAVIIGGDSSQGFVVTPK